MYNIPIELHSTHCIDKWQLLGAFLLGAIVCKCLGENKNWANIYEGKLVSLFLSETKMKFTVYTHYLVISTSSKLNESATHAVKARHRENELKKKFARSYELEMV